MLLPYLKLFVALSLTWQRYNKNLTFANILAQKCKISCVFGNSTMSMFILPRFIASRRGFLLFCFALSALLHFLYPPFTLRLPSILGPYTVRLRSIYLVILDFSPYQTLVKTLSSPSPQHLIPSSIHQKSLCRFVAMSLFVVFFAWQFYQYCQFPYLRA